MRPRNPLIKLRRELEQIEKRIADVAAQRALVEEQLCQDPMHVAYQTLYAELGRDADSLETRWMEIGTAIEAAEALACDSDRA